MNKMFFIALLVIGCASHPPINTANFSWDERKLIESNQIKIGMGEQALLASWGRLYEYRQELKGWQLVEIRYYTNQFGTTKTYVYKNSGYFTNQYKSVYVSNGQVTGWTN